MDKKNIALDVVARLAGAERGELKPEMDLVADLGIDSPKALQLLVDLEDRLGIEISDDDAAKMETLGDVVAYVEALG
jgi:acyl carrier protein